FPPSLVNIFKEVASDTGAPVPLSGDLSRWAEQGVLLLNSTLTVESGKAASHKRLGWECFTQQIIDTLNAKRTGIVYILWGSHAQRVGRNIDPTVNCVISGVHPSPLSAYRGFFGSRPFSAANEYLLNQGKAAIKW
ncbi:MAG: uracil-DNA glycosylase, partial [Rikenellaceae bacterium]